MKFDPIDALVRSQRVVICLGPGGVGKTTTSVALAFAGAKAGRRVALISIDPAKRLATAMGIELSHELKRIEFPDSMSTKGGALFAAMLDQKSVFDQMVKKHTPSEKIANRILSDPIYISASTNLSGPLEYMALAKLQELSDSPEFDLIVVDTPPDSHALDFLSRPNILGRFMDQGVMSKLIKPVAYAGKLGFGGLMSVGEKLLGGVTQVTGLQSLTKFSEFMLLIQDVVKGFHAASQRVTEVLKHSSTSYVLVCAPTQPSIRSVTTLMTELQKLGYSANGLVINKVLSQDDVSNTTDERDRAILTTRFQGEQKAIEEVTKFMNKSQKIRDFWVAKVRDATGDLSSFESFWGYWERLKVQ